MTPATVLTVDLTVRQGDRDYPVQIAGAFDRLDTVEAARAAGRAIGDLLADNLARRVQLGTGS